LIGAVNAFGGAINTVKSQLDGSLDEVPNVARTYKAAGVPSVVVGDHNYGEGSSREHAAMEPRHLGVCAVIVKSFARIHETNLKKQGMLGFTFVNEADYNLVQEDDTFNFTDLDAFAPGKKLSLDLVHADGSTDSIKLNHTYNAQQIEWFKAGSALNLIKAQNAQLTV
jgi:aconitate hydratase